ncbi:MAG: T9SS type A sorting domain-containing protein, partial [Bacteroidetes bacterium]|nr:T9SS type A sorting domain-containing protein [Bacteroidota bacterium]
PRTTIRFAVASTSFVNISVFDILGREVTVLLSEEVAPGMHETTFDGHSLASGIYLYSIRAGGFFQSRVMHLSK